MPSESGQAAHQRLTLVVACLAVLMVQLDTTLVNLGLHATIPDGPGRRGGAIATDGGSRRAFEPRAAATPRLPLGRVRRPLPSRASRTYHTAGQTLPCPLQTVVVDSLAARRERVGAMGCHEIAHRAV
jgi:hypothetical protein